MSSGFDPNNIWLAQDTLLCEGFTLERISEGLTSNATNIIVKFLLKARRIILLPIKIR